MFCFIYLFMVIYGSFTIIKLFDFIPAHSWYNVPLYFSWKNLVCEKVFQIDLLEVPIDVLSYS